MKQCSKCGEIKSVDIFAKGQGKDGLQAWCRDCQTKYRREKRRATKAALPPKTPKVKQVVTPEQRRGYNLKYLYGITVEQYDSILASQGGACAACRKPVAESTKSFTVDHDHRCCPGARSCGKCVRGLLCFSCNVVLGHVDDNLFILQGLTNYVSRSRFDI